MQRKENQERKVPSTVRGTNHWWRINLVNVTFNHINLEVAFLL